jgi:hypothetical protein
MSLEQENRKLRERIEELEFVKDFQQDLIANFEKVTGQELSKKFLPEHLSNEIQKAKTGSVKSTFTEMYSDIPVYVAINEKVKHFPFFPIPNNRNNRLSGQQKKESILRNDSLREKDLYRKGNVMIIKESSDSIQKLTIKGTATIIVGGQKMTLSGDSIEINMEKTQVSNRAEPIKAEELKKYMNNLKDQFDTTSNLSHYFSVSPAASSLVKMFNNSDRSRFYAFNNLREERIKQSEQRLKERIKFNEERQKQIEKQQKERLKQVEQRTKEYQKLLENRKKQSEQRLKEQIKLKEKQQKQIEKRYEERLKESQKRIEKLQKELKKIVESQSIII